MFSLLTQNYVNTFSIIYPTENNIQYITVSKDNDHRNYTLYNSSKFVYFTNKYCYENNYIRYIKDKEQYKCDNSIFSIMNNKISIRDINHRIMLTLNNYNIPHITYYIKKFLIRIYVSIAPTVRNNNTLIVILHLKNNKDYDNYVIVYKNYKIYIQYSITQYKITNPITSITEFYHWLFTHILDYISIF